MKIRTNSIMTRTLEERKHDFVKETVTLPTELMKLIDSGFRTEQDCVLFKDFEYFGPGLLDSDDRKTEYEDFLNDVHIDDYVTETSDEFEYLKVGLEFSKRIHAGLKVNFKTDFRITVSYSETSYEGQEIDNYGGCVVKFYMIRPSCDDKFRIDDLDKFETEGVMVLE
ncbi:hypothetical protein NF867_09390 [Solitalea sp. MAHUQ-68]|uniref:Uncharacterized protein n=1 Tax=Solitalea agri TaxID=2953739 RepID=A0A9X2F2L4_9SPHI|nr:hypothetical protein [Solitalea agri]MCO4293076.1 hypothetical protein [Solitalea agri]